MLNLNFIRIAAAAAGTLLLAGCAVRLDPERPEAPIAFSAGSSLLRDDVTKGATPKEGTEFAVGDQLHVWGWHSAANQFIRFGGTTPVTLQSSDVWDYAPHQFWNWKDGEDYYDFLAVYPQSCTATPVEPTPNAPNLMVSVDYNATESQFDLMAAGFRRSEKTVTTVPLTFSHLLSAVSVQVKNASTSDDAITLMSCQFEKLITSCTFGVSFDGTSLSSLAGSPSRPQGKSLGLEIQDEGSELTPNAHFPGEKQWDLMVPQTLNGDETPSLCIEYRKGGEDFTVELPLKDIKNSDTKTEITDWKPGVKYSYEVELKFGGGITVVVKTTPWEVVEAQTPGLMI